MSTNEACSNQAEGSASAASVDLKLEMAVIPVSGVDRAKEFCSKLGWRLDTDRASGDDFRLVQFTPPGSGSSILFGVNLTSAAPGSAQSLLLTVSDVEAARPQPAAQGIDASGHFTVRPGPLSGSLPSALESPRRTPSVSAVVLSSPSEIRTATQVGAGGHEAASGAHCGRHDVIVRERSCPSDDSRHEGTRGMKRGLYKPILTGQIGTPNTWRANNPAKDCRSSPRSAIARAACMSFAVHVVHGTLQCVHSHVRSMKSKLRTSKMSALGET